MGMRKYYREMAKARLKACGFKTEDIGMGMPNSVNRKFQRTYKGIKKLHKLHEMKMAMWRNVLWGPMAPRAKAAVMNEYKKAAKPKPKKN